MVGLPLPSTRHNYRNMHLIRAGCSCCGTLPSPAKGLSTAHANVGLSIRPRAEEGLWLGDDAPHS